MGVGEQLSHGHGGGGEGSDLPKVIDLLGGKNVFHKEHANRFHASGKLQSQRRCQVFVDIMEKLDLPAQLVAHLLKHLGDCLQVEFLVEGRPPEAGLGSTPLSRRHKTASAIAAPAHLNANVPKTLFHVSLHAFHTGLGGVAAGVGVEGHSVSDFSTQKLIERHVGPLALDVPQGHVQSGLGHIGDGSVAPVGTHMGPLPQVLDAVGILAHPEGSQVLFNGGLDGPGQVGVVGRPQPIETGLAGDDLWRRPRNSGAADWWR